MDFYKDLGNKRPKRKMPVTTPAFFEVTNCLTLNYDNSYYVLKNSISSF
jgi:hypothetical protein